MSPPLPPWEGMGSPSEVALTPWFSDASTNCLGKQNYFPFVLLETKK